MTTLSTLAPEFEPIIEALAEAPPIRDLSVEAARAMYEENIVGEPVALDSVRDLTIAGSSGDIDARLYMPNKDPAGILLFLHGGGWVVGNLTVYDVSVRGIAAASQCAVIAVEYRLAPEHPFPAGLDDCYAALEWVAQNRDELGLADKPLIVAGDSAGGNLAAAVSIACRDRGGPRIDGQLLIYPVTDGRLQSPSYRERGSGALLTAADMEWFWNQYATGESRLDPLVSVCLESNHSDLPPAIVVTAEFDPLRDEGIAYAEKLKAAGVQCKHLHYCDLPHGFLTFSQISASAAQALAEFGDLTRQLALGNAFD